VTINPAILKELMIYPSQKSVPFHSLLPQNLLNLTNFSLNFTGDLFTGAFLFQLRIITYFPGYLLDLTLYFVKRTFRLVLTARFHGVFLFIVLL
jgi:hypothetical protein